MVRYTFWSFIHPLMAMNRSPKRVLEQAIHLLKYRIFLDLDLWLLLSDILFMFHRLSAKAGTANLSRLIMCDFIFFYY